MYNKNWFKNMIFYEYFIQFIKFQDLGNPRRLRQA